MSGVSAVSLWYQFGTAGNWTLLGSQAGSSGSFDFAPEDGDGTYCFAAQAADVAGNEQPAPAGAGTTCTVYTEQTDYYIYLPVMTKD